MPWLIQCNGWCTRTRTRTLHTARGCAAHVSGLRSPSVDQEAHALPQPLLTMLLPACQTACTLVRLTYGMGDTLPWNLNTTVFAKVPSPAAMATSTCESLMPSGGMAILVDRYRPAG